MKTSSAPPPPLVWLKLQAPVLKLPQNCLCLLFIMAKTFSVLPFHRGKTSRIVASLPVISDQSLSMKTNSNIIFTTAYIPPEREPICVGESHWLKPILYCAAKPFALGPGVGLDPNATISHWRYQHAGIQKH